MKMIVSACFGFALAMSAFALSATPSHAAEIPAVSPTLESGITKVDERGERCEHARHECRERHGEFGREYRECLERRDCGERDERADRCEHVRHECRERHGDRDREFHECLERERCER